MSFCMRIFELDEFDVVWLAFWKVLWHIGRRQCNENRNRMNEWMNEWFRGGEEERKENATVQPAKYVWIYVYIHVLYIIKQQKRPQQQWHHTRAFVRHSAICMHEYAIFIYYNSLILRSCYAVSVWMSVYVCTYFIIFHLVSILPLVSTFLHRARFFSFPVDFCVKYVRHTHMHPCTFTHAHP